MIKSLDTKIADIHANPSGSKAFIIADVGRAGAVIIVAAMAATLSLVTVPHRLPQLSGETQ